MKKHLLAGGLATVLILGACGDTESEETAEEPTQEEIEQAEADFNESSAETSEDATEKDDEVLSEETSETDQGTRSNPYQMGDVAEVTVTDMDDDYNEMKGIANISFDNILRGEEALAEINEGPGTHEAPEDGMEWMTFDFTFELVEYVDADTQYTFATNFPTYNENGEQVVGSMTSVGEREGNTVFEGGSITRRQALTVPSDGAILIGFSDSEEEIFFEVE